MFILQMHIDILLYTLVNIKEEKNSLVKYIAKEDARPDATSYIQKSNLFLFSVSFIHFLILNVYMYLTLSSFSCLSSHILVFNKITNSKNH